MNKKAYMKTLEAFLAVLLTILFIMIIAPQNPTRQKDDVNFEILSILAQDDEFRGCVLSYNKSCVDSFIQENIDFGYYTYTFNISSSPYTRATIKRDNVFLKTYFFAGNETQYSPRILKLYYWKE